MTLAPLLDASLAIQLHLAAALLAIVSGAFAIQRRSRDRLHKIAGYVWITLMVSVSLSSFFITSVVGPSIGGFGPIHLLSVFVLFSVSQGLHAVIAGQIAKHQKVMRSLYLQSLGIAGLFTFLPGRRLNVALFGDTPELGFAVIVLGGATLWAVSRRWAEQRSPA